MANSIALFKEYLPILDEVYRNASLTAILDGAPELARAGANANEMIIQKLAMTGLGAYSRNGGYTNGTVTLTNETVKCNFDRSAMFNVDALDNEETAAIAFGRLAGEFERNKVIPELDAFRLSTYATAAITAGNSASADLTASTVTAKTVIAAIRTAHAKMDDAEVPQENRVLYITSTLKGMIDDADTTASRAAMEQCANVIVIPQSRFYTAITQYDGTTSGQTDGGYVEKSGAYKLNFLLIHKPAIIQYQKHVVPKVISPDQNQAADAWKFGYRNVGIADVYDNKVAGIYAHYGTTAKS